MRPHPDDGVPGKGCTVSQAKHQRAGPLNQQSRGYRLRGRQEERDLGKDPNTHMPTLRDHQLLINQC